MQGAFRQPYAAMNDIPLQHELLGVVTGEHLYTLTTCEIERIFDQVHQNLFKSLLVSRSSRWQKVVLLLIDFVSGIPRTAKTYLGSLKLSLTSKIFHDEIEDKPWVEVFFLDFKFSNS